MLPLKVNTTTNFAVKFVRMKVFTLVNGEIDFSELHSYKY